MNHTQSKNPNIVFILADDQGPWALGAGGNHEILTPNLDRIAAEGMRFSSFFCVSPVCSPARASLLTGRIPSQHGIHDWIRAGNGGASGQEHTVDYLQGQRAYTEELAEHGYNCGLSGKWHLGDSYTPQKGFTHWYVHEKGGSSYYNAPMIRDGKLEIEPRYVTEAITDDALRFIDSHAGEDAPFYLSVHYTAPHSPWIDNHPKAFTDLYEDCTFETCPQEPLHPNFLVSSVGKGTVERTRECLIGYFAAVTAMDHHIGRILDRLEQHGIREETLVVFTSDNGFNCGHHGIWGKGNGTFPQNMYDTSVKVPFLASHPGRIPAGSVCDEMVSGYDFMPTLLEYAGIPYTHDSKLPGRSFAGLLLGEAAEASALEECVVVYDEYGPVRMARTKEWKYVHRYPYGPHELYNMANDPEERKNLIDNPVYKTQAEQMKDRLENWFVRYVDPAMDGIHEPVTGKGQLDLAGPAGRGKKAFADLE